MARARTLKLGRVTRDHFATKFHNKAYEELLEMLRRLDKNEYLDKRGTFAKTLPGPRSVGKSTCLTNFASAAPLVAPGIISFFFSLTSGQSVPRDVLDSGSLCTTAIRVCFPEAAEVPGHLSAQDYLVSLLMKSSLKMVFIVDEVDQLFKANEDERFIRFAKTSLGELACLGNNPEGRLIIVLSGSSSRITAFIKGDQNELSDAEKRDYPVLRSQINMNSSRFKCLSVDYPRPDSLEDALAIRHPAAELASVVQTRGDPQMIQKARQLLFEFGCNPRNLDDNLARPGGDIVPTHHSAKHLWMQLLLLWSGIPENRRLFVKLGKWRQSYRDRFWKGKWTPYQCQSCCGTPRSCEHACEKMEWETTFTPVTLSKMYESRGPGLPCDLESLQYDGYIIIINDKIFPASLGLFLRNVKEWAPSFTKLMKRRYNLFCTSPQIQVQLLDDLSSEAKEVLKDAVRCGVAKAFT